MKHTKARKKFRFSAFWTFAALVALTLLAPSSGPVEIVSDMIARQTPAPMETARPDPADAAPTAEPVPAESAAPADEALPSGTDASSSGETGADVQAEDAHAQEELFASSDDVSAPEIGDGLFPEDGFSIASGEEEQELPLDKDEQPASSGSDTQNMNESGEQDAAHNEADQAVLPGSDEQKPVAEDAQPALLGGEQDMNEADQAVLPGSDEQMPVAEDAQPALSDAEQEKSMLSHEEGDALSVEEGDAVSDGESSSISVEEGGMLFNEENGARTVEEGGAPSYEIDFFPAEGAVLQVAGEEFDPQGDGSMIKTLPMDDFSFGTAPLESGYSEDRRVYEDESITVVTYQEKWDGTIYSVAEVTIAHPSQLRTAIAGTPSSPARSKMVKLAERVNAVVAIDGDYYADRKGAYAVRQSQLLSDSFASDLDLLVIDYDGNFHCILASEKEQKIAEMEGQIYQCLSFGPVLIRDGQHIQYPEDYQFGLDYLNPRAAIGQLGERKYMFVVASGRTEQSLAITAGKLQDYMLAKGCIQAYNVDGGASAELVFDGQSYSPLTPSGERGLYDIIYFASTAGEE